MSSSKKMIVLMTSDGQSFEVEESVAMQSVTIKNMLEDVGSDDGTIPLPNVTSDVLTMVIEYCKRHASNNSSSVKQEEEGGSSSGGAADKSTSDADLKAFDTEFVNVDQSTLFDLILAANYLNIKSLLDLTCETVADMCKGKNPEEIRKHFNIENDFSPEEEEEIIKENGWAWEHH